MEGSGESDTVTDRVFAATNRLEDALDRELGDVSDDDVAGSATFLDGSLDGAQVVASGGDGGGAANAGQTGGDKSPPFGAASSMPPSSEGSGATRPTRSLSAFRGAADDRHADGPPFPAEGDGTNGAAAGGASPQRAAAASDAAACSGGASDDDEAGGLASPSPKVPATGDETSASDAAAAASDDDWRRRRKHVFVLSSTGRPIFTRWGDESAFPELFGILQVLVSMVACEHRTLHAAPAGQASSVGGGSGGGGATSHYVATKGATAAGSVSGGASNAGPAPGRASLVPGFVPHPSRGGGANTAAAPDTLRRLAIGTEHVLHVHTAGELIFAMVTKTHESTASCVRQLHMIHAQVLSVLPNVQTVLSRNPGYDVRRMFANGDVAVTKALIRRLNGDPAFLLRAVAPVRLPRDIRSDVDAVLRAHRGGSDHVFSLLFHSNRLASVVSPAGSALHQEDVLLLQNFVYCVTGSQRGQAWAPLCLPRFNDTGYLWCYAAFIEELLASSDATGAASGGAGPSPPPSLLLVQLATHQGAFPALSAAAHAIAHALQARGYVTQLAQCAGNSALPIDPVALGTAARDLTYFAFVSESSQIVASTLPPSMAASRARRKDVFRLLVRLRSVALRCSHAPDPLLTHCSDSCNVLVSLGTSALTIGGGKCGELYLVFLPLTRLRADVMAECGGRVLKWLKAVEPSLFLTRAAHWPESDGDD